MRERILIVDDEPAIRGLLAAHLAALGHGCLPARDGAEALALAAAEPRPALVLSDIEMPGMSGLELRQRLKALDPELQVVMISGLHDLEVVRRCLREGAYDYIVKPFAAEDLLNTVERALERGRLVRQNEEYRRNLERMVHEQTAEIRRTRDIALVTLAKLAESRDNATGQHLERMAAYSRRLAEQLAGGPYAGGLAAERIPLAARIVAVADAYDAITSERPYKAGCDHGEAVRRIALDRGRHFDPVLVDSFLDCQRDFPAIRSRFLDPPTAARTAAADPRGWKEEVRIPL